ncbi:hypothetical protein BU664_05685 [Staphylococcus chromogenes]|uniref:hypothetical protein n=1 Tax=Staphylococcus chromogenes TaxID=46126 RepID=UPI000E69015C|nr:hypothetical protein [Staphylococcus chromogenes]RIM21277.1 hypothetical protein BU664_05685 [Staphylococcus chromogenes]
MISQLALTPQVVTQIQVIFDRELSFNSGIRHWRPQYQMSTLQKNTPSTKWLKMNQQCLKIYFQVSIDEAYKPIMVLRKLHRHVQMTMKEYCIPVEVELHMQITHFLTKQ